MNQLDHKILIRLQTIFKNKKWDIDTYHFVFEKFCHCLQSLKPDERELVLDLTDNYLWITENQYTESIREILSKNSNIFQNIDTLYIIPLVDPQKNILNKSGNFLAYLFNSLLIKNHIALNNIKIKKIDSSDKIPPPALLHEENEKILLVDDFIGSGNSFYQAYDYYKNKSYNKNDFIIFSLVIQAEGLNKILTDNFIVLYGNKTYKGISDYYSEKDAVLKKEIMKKIGKSIGVSRNYQLGFNESEALVTMIRTPNNTFPIYWYEEKDGIRKAPFSRF